MNLFHNFLLEEGFRMFTCRPYKAEVDITDRPTAHYFSTMGDLKFKYVKEGYPIIYFYFTYPSGCDILVEFGEDDYFYPFKFFLYIKRENILYKTDIRLTNKPFNLSMQQISCKDLLKSISNKEFICFDDMDKLVSEEHYNSLPKRIKVEKCLY